METHTIKPHQQYMIVEEYIWYCHQGYVEKACILASNHTWLNLLRFTPDFLRQRIIHQLTTWQKFGPIDCQSAIDRLLGFYAYCARCGEYKPRAIGDQAPDQQHIRFEYGTHICDGCRKDIQAQEHTHGTTLVQGGSQETQTGQGVQTRGIDL